LFVADPQPPRLPHLGDHRDSFRFAPNHPTMTSLLTGRDLRPCRFSAIIVTMGGERTPDIPAEPRGDESTGHTL
jgi:hypothetical protein